MRKLIYLTIFLWSTSHAWSQSAGTTGADILEVPIGVRAIALGGAYTALGDDVYVIGYNPAGLADISEYNIGIDYMQSYAGVEIGALSAAVPTKDYGILAGQLVYRSMPDIANTLATDPTISASDFLLTIADAQQFGRVSFGGALKTIYSNLGPEQAFTEAVDFGVKIEWFDTNFGAAIQNIGPDVKFEPNPQAQDPLPLTIRLGAARPVFVSPAATLLASADIFSINGEEGLQEAVGLEYWHHSVLALRLGYRFSDPQDLQGGITAGAALRYSLGQLQYEIGFAWQPNAISSTFLANTYTFGLLLWF